MTTATTTKPFTLYTGSTPNGFQVSIFLEELRAINPSIDYDVFKIVISTMVQKERLRSPSEPWFIKLNPNGRFPVIVDHTRNDFVVFETAAILLYLAQHYDKNHVFWLDSQSEPDDYSEMLQWIFFGHGGIGPMQGQSHHFQNYAPEVIPYGQKRYLDETKRLYNVLEIRLQDRDWLAGPGRGKYSLADIKSFPWVRRHPFAGIETLDEFPRVKAWVERNYARSGVEAGLKVPPA